MKKRSFLLPLAVSLAALASSANATPAAPPKTAPQIEITAAATIAAPAALVIQRASDVKAQYAGHTSHASHSSHSSHYSSR